VENKRKDIVEKPQKTRGPVKEPRPDKTSRQAAQQRVQGSPGDVLLVHFFPPLLIFVLLK